MKIHSFNNEPREVKNSVTKQGSRQKPNLRFLDLEVIGIGNFILCDLL